MLLRTMAAGLAVSVASQGSLGVIMTEDFESYKVGEDPAGPNISLVQPDMMWVDSAPLGCASQALMLEPPLGEYAAARYGMAPLSTGKVRFEVDVSMSGYMTGHFFQALRGTVVWSRLVMTESGTIAAATLSPGNSTVGTYTPWEPFRVRVDLDLDAMLYWVAIDNELDGFDDDPRLGPWLPYNDLVDLPYVDTAALSMSRYDTGSRQSDLYAVAYDNLFVIPAPGAGALVAVGLVALLGGRADRRR